MKAQAVEQATDRLKRARAALDAARNSEPNIDDFASAWTDFLLAANGVYAKLEQGAKRQGTSDGWFNQKKELRRTDPLLNWMHQARNEEEHGLEGSFSLDTPYQIDGQLGSSAEDATYVSEEGIPLFRIQRIAAGLRPRFKIQNIGGFSGEIKLMPPVPKLTELVNKRAGHRIPAPGEHLGAAISDCSPLGAGTLFCDYLDGLIMEAQQRVS